MWFMWQYVVNAYETWEYFPRGMFTIPAAITLAWGGGIAAFLWFWVNCLFNTKYAQEEFVAVQGDSGSDMEAAERERGGYRGTAESPRLREARTGEKAVEEARRNKLQGSAKMKKPFIEWTWWHVVRIVAYIVLTAAVLGTVSVAYDGGVSDGEDNGFRAGYDYGYADAREIVRAAAVEAGEEFGQETYDEGYEVGYTEGCLEIADTWADVNYDYYLRVYDFCTGR